MHQFVYIVRARTYFLFPVILEVLLSIFPRSLLDFTFLELFQQSVNLIEITKAEYLISCICLTLVVINISSLKQNRLNVILCLLLINIQIEFRMVRVESST